MEKQTLIDAHIWLMLFVWLLAVPAAIALSAWGREHDKPWWAKAHKLIMAICVTIPMTVAAAFGIIATGGFRAKPHMIIGLIVVAGAWCQILLGVVNHIIFRVRGRAKGAARPWHNSLHVWLGRVLQLLAVINIPIGFAMHRSGPAWFIVYGIWVFGGCIGAVLLFRHIMLLRASKSQQQQQQQDQVRASFEVDEKGSIVQDDVNRTTKE
ncbi:hypothetical protein LRAMOSA05043 [Lichtheimia ramosa]|uniref:Cytochrome b561 domain-containing protein n=1 Tax=Lichtheimia ramosa TaxID=688394 RepID=A0A077X032_9FUNG|nr:hypothetical protein LRAMOSA05043 [Lichtheimia ramosa]